MKNVTVSAPGKLMLLGEHAVVYNRPCLVTAVDQRMRANVALTPDNTFSLEAPEVHITGYKKPMDILGKGEIPKGAQFVEVAVKNFQARYPFSEGVTVITASEFSSLFGFGSSSASTVCILKALSELSGKKLDNKQLFDLAYKTILDVQGKGSGFDVAAAIFGGTLYFVTGGKVIEPLLVHDMPLIIGYTGVKADTVTLMRDVAEKMKKQPERVNRIYDAIAKLVEQAKQKMIEGDWQRLGKLMDFNQEYLRDLGVSSDKLEQLIGAAKKAGAWGAKLSGAGGGDCMIALVAPEKRKAVEIAITQAGGQVIHIMPNAPGVRRETTDNQEELFVVVDPSDTIVGYKSRYECLHDKTLIHRAVELMIFDKRGRVLLQKRSTTKDTDPGMWCPSVGGHVDPGESYEQAMRRETQEELGVAIPITYVTKGVVHFPNETEMEALFTAVYDGPFYPDEVEMTEVRFFEKRALPLLVASKQITLTSAAEHSLRVLGWL